MTGAARREVAVEYPIGHRRRRAEGLPLLFDKLRENLSGELRADRVDEILTLFKDRRRLESLTVPQLMERFL